MLVSLLVALGWRQTAFSDVLMPKPGPVVCQKQEMFDIEVKLP